MYFDVDRDGFLERTAWVGPTDGLLVIDLDINGNFGAVGVIERGEEINFSSLPGELQNLHTWGTTSVGLSSDDQAFALADCSRNHGLGRRAVPWHRRRRDAWSSGRVMAEPSDAWTRSGDRVVSAVFFFERQRCVGVHARSSRRVTRTCCWHPRRPSRKYAEKPHFRTIGASVCASASTCHNDPARRP